MDAQVNDSEPGKSQTKIERSAAYAAITIAKAEKFVAEVYKNFRSSPTKRDDIIGLIEGAHNRDLAAATYYGLLKREKDKYQVSDLYKTITNPISEKEKQEALLIVFGLPKLNKELIDKFDGDEIPKELKAHLTRFHKITEDAAPLAAEVFIENAKYCKVLNELNVLDYKQTVLKLLDPSNTTIPAESTEEKEENREIIKEKEQAIEPETQNNIPQKQVQLIPEMLNEDKLRIRITNNRFVYLIYPLDLTEKDISIIRKQLDVLDELIKN